MEQENRNLLDLISSDIRMNADLVSSRVKEETESMREDQLSFYREGLNKETSAYLDSELKELREYASSKRSKEKMEVRRQLLTLRSSLSEKVFAEVKKELQNFVQSDAYEAYLRRQLNSLNCSSTAVFYVRRCDLERMAKLLKENNLDNPVEPAEFAIGGFRCHDDQKRTVFSCALSEKLAEAEEWFHMNSGFRVQETEAK